MVGSAEGREEVVTHQLTTHTARVNSTGGDKQEVLHVHTHAHTQTDGRTQGLLAPHYHPNVHTYVHTQTHTSATTHDKVIQVTFTHMQ